jgi:hydroxyethylthiazole kinase-like uncharacterized protein yjeF
VTSAQIVTPARLRDWPLGEPGVGKEARGTALVLGGSASTPGAVRLAGEAALRAGAGKLKLATARSVAAPLAVAVPEARVIGYDEDRGGSIDPAAAAAVTAMTDGVDVLLAGPGFVDPEAAAQLLSAVLPQVACPVVLDAVATAYLTSRPDGLSHLADRAIVTANTNELAHLLRRAEVPADEVLGGALEVAQRAGVVVLVGGAAKHVAAPDGRAWRIEGGGPGLGVSGSGDVQAGIVAGLLARGEPPAKAAVWGAYVHARAGEVLAGSVGRVGYLARELPPVLPRVIAEIG